MTSTDWRALCAELADALDHNRQCLMDDRRLTHPLADKARAALAEPVGEGVTDEELLELAQHHSVSYTLSDGSVVYPLQEGCDMRDDVLSFARAVLARWGHQPAPPVEGDDCPACEGVPKPGNQPCAVCGRSASSAEGEVAEMAWWLRSLEDASVWFESGSPEALKLTRATCLQELERHQLARLAKSGVSPETVARCNAAAEALVTPADDADDLPATWAEPATAAAA